MWLETITLQTHHSCKMAIEGIYREVMRETSHASIQVSAFFHHGAVLNVTWHLHHHNAVQDGSEQGEHLVALLERFGPVHHRAWQPLNNQISRRE